MATLTFSYTDSDDSQIWLKGTGAAGQTWSPSISGIPSGATINSVVLSFANGHTTSSPGRSSIYWGTSTSGTRIWTTSASLSGSSATVDLSSYVTGNGTINLYFYKTANSSSSTSNVYFTGVKITVTYTIPYTACGAPTSCAVTLTITHDATTLSWSGAKAGTSNAISSYGIQRCESADGSTWGSWADLTTVSTSAASGSVSVSPPDTYGNYYKYRVQTRGSAGSSYYSGWKESTNTLRRDHEPLSAFTDPTLTVGETLVKAIHMTELQRHINTLRAFYGLSAYSFSTPTNLADWSAQVVELRTALDDIGKTHDAWLTVSENKPSAQVMQQLRDIVLAV